MAMLSSEGLEKIFNNLLNRRGKVTSVTIKEFLDDDSIDCNPIHQRFDVGDVKKKQGIIECLFSGRYFGFIVLNDKGVEYKGEFRYESIDGGHRKRAIREFIECKFKVHGLFFNEYPEKTRQAFLGLELNYLIYDRLTNAEKGKTFRELNTQSNMLEQEIRNSYGDTPIANIVRSYCRASAHDVWDYVSFDNARMKTEELVARMLCQYFGDTPLSTRANHSALDKMYADDTITEKDVKNTSAKLDKLLNFIIDIAKTRSDNYESHIKNTTRTKMGLREFVLWQRIYLFLEEKFGSNFKVKDYRNLWIKINLVFQEWSAPIKEQPEYRTKTIEGLAVLDENKAPCQQFVSSLGEYQGEPQLRYAIQVLLLEGVDFAEFVDSVQKTGRFFTVSQMQRKLAVQNFCCDLDGEDLSYADAEGSHIISAKNGGTNETSNLVMLRTCWNQDMGEMNYDEYKELWSKRKSDEVFVNKWKNKN